MKQKSPRRYDYILLAGYLKLDDVHTIPLKLTINVIGKVSIISMRIHLLLLLYANYITGFLLVKYKITPFYGKFLLSTKT